MKFQIKLSTFKDYLKRLNFSVKSVSSRIEFTGILISTFDNKITFECRNDYTDMKIIENNSSKIKILEKGQILIKGSTINEIVQRMDGEFCQISKVDSNLATIESKGSKYKINLLIDEKYERSVFENIKDKEVKIPSNIFKDSANKVLFAGNEYHNKFIFQGMNLKIENGIVTSTVCDGIRIASYKEKINSNIILNKNIPLKVISELSKILPLSNEEYNFQFSETKGIVSTKNIIIQFSLIEGTFPTFNKFFEEEKYDKKLIINREELLNNIEKATILNSNRNDISNRIEIDLNNERMNIESREQEIGSSKITITELNYKGDEIKISISPKIIYEGLKYIEDKEITIFMSSPKSSLFLKTKNNKFHYLMSPMI